MKIKMLNWAKQFNIFCFLDNHQYDFRPQRYECVLAAGIKQGTGNSISALDELYKLVDQKDWVFGHLNYEAGYSNYGLHSGQQDQTGFPLFRFFIPETVVYITGEHLHIEDSNPDGIYDEIIRQEDTVGHHTSGINLSQALSKDRYIDIIEKLKDHIHRGDCYEINFCQDFYADNVLIDPITVYHNLEQLSPNPFSALYRLDDSYLVCASPERFLFKEGDTIISQPMKGTAKRDPNNITQDKANLDALQNSAKEQAENVMVVDLVRNDLSRVCKEGTVKVDELFGVYSFPQVHQMVSTISGKLETGKLSQIMKACFPMGSMTGAPKKRVMELISQYELSARGIFSGSVGYINPVGDFDFNVVIRSIMYNKKSKYLCYKTGSGITFYSDAEKEWEECLLKGEAIKKVLTGSAPFTL